MNYRRSSRLLYSLGVTPVARRLLTRRRRLAVTFHGVISNRWPELPDWAQPELTVDDLQAIVGWLSSRFKFLTPEDYLAGGKAGLLITFDDGFANNWSCALPILERAAAPAVFFVATQHVVNPRDWMPWKRDVALRLGQGCLSESGGRKWEIDESVQQELFDGASIETVRSSGTRKLLTIGAHTHSHPRLPACSPAELTRELRESRSLLEDWTGRSVDLMAYPFGAYDRRVAAAVAATGYRAGFAEQASGEVPRCFELPRIGLYSSTRHYLNAKLCGLLGRGLDLAPIRRPGMVAND